MKITYCVLKYLILFVLLIGNVSLSYGLDLAVQPRLETGLMSYSLEMSALSRTTLQKPDASTGNSYTQDKESYSDTLKMVAGGGTVFFNRLFIDVSGQWAYGGSDQTVTSASEYKELDASGNSTFTTLSINSHGQFDRSDYAVSLGYNLNQHFSIFAGYKWAQTDLERTYDIPFSYLPIDQKAVSHGRIRARGIEKFKYDGPFIGIARGWPVEGYSVFNGLISINAGVAQLSSKLSHDMKGTIKIDTVNGNPLDLDADPYAESGINKGDTIGLAMRFNWWGITAIKDLTYSIAVGGYRYHFNTDNPKHTDIIESVLTFKVGIAYTF